MFACADRDQQHEDKYITSYVDRKEVDKWTLDCGQLKKVQV